MIIIIINIIITIIIMNACRRRKDMRWVLPGFEAEIVAEEAPPNDKDE